ncbi:MAG: UDP-N-acetylmuramate--L-alanine ligase [Caldimicrobium sp.]
MKVYFIGIGGIGMSGVAGIAKELGLEVYGSEDKELYPPASQLLKELHIEVLKASEENLLLHKPDLIVVGNAIKRDHPEVIKAVEMKIPILSFPEFIERYLLSEKKSLVVAGTHGKTTTASLLSYLLDALGEDPSFLVGGLIKNYNRNFHLGKRPWFVLEGDEYPSAFFNSNPKFLHYKPYALILTSLEYDHIDVYKSFYNLKEAFKNLIQLIPSQGILLYCYDELELRNLIQEISPSCKILSYGQTEGSDYQLLNYELSFETKTFLSRGIIRDPFGEKFELILPLPGFYNLLNALGVIALLEHLGLERKRILPAFLKFKGVKRRQEILSVNEKYLLIDDFAHHPTAVRLTLRELKEAYKPNKTILFFEPRTNSSKRKIFQESYRESLSLADVIFLKPPPGLVSIPEEERINLWQLIEGLNQAGKIAHILENTVSIKNLLSFAEEKNLIVFMSSAYMKEQIEVVWEVLGV